jgi:membrane-bound lytic murein transglycosylase D
MLKIRLIRTVLVSYCWLITFLLFDQIEFSSPIKRVSPPIPVSECDVNPVIINTDSGLNANVVKFTHAYLKKNSYGLAKLKKRDKPSFKVIHSVFIKYDIPLELKYLAVVESNLKNDLVSRTGAKGLWQFMPATAREHGLKITEDHDERLHVYKSSVAAAKYLKQLYDEFGDWLLVVAAYNSGPGHVHRAIRKSGSNDFWELQNFLPKETRNHVKKFISVHYYFEEKTG